MDGSSTSEIKTTELIGPTRWVPCPAGNRVVDDGAPDEHKDYTREQACAVDGGTNGESGSDCCEHALIDGEEDVRYLGAAD